MAKEIRIYKPLPKTKANTASNNPNVRVYKPIPKPTASATPKPRTSYEQFMAPFKKLTAQSASDKKQIAAQKKKEAQAKKTGKWDNGYTN